MEKKYILTEETKVIYGHTTLHRIKALRSFGDVKEGDLGGWIENEKNLSHQGSCWVYDEARVYGKAQICGEARVYGKALICGEAWIYDEAQIYGNALVYGKNLICGEARVYGKAQICGEARVYGKAQICGEAWIYDKAQICGEAWVYGQARIRSTARISSTQDYLVVGPIGSRNDFTTFYKGGNGAILVSCGCFTGTIEEFEVAVAKTHGENEYANKYHNTTQFIKACF